MFKVTQLPGHQGAKCFFQMGGCLHPCSDHPASRFVYQHLFKFPASSFPPPPSLPRFALSLSPSFLFCSPHPTLLCVCLLSTGPSPTESGHLEVPGDDRDPAIPRPLPCGCSRKGGQRAEEGDTAAKMELGPSSGWERDEETRNLGTEGVGVRGAKAASECKSGPLPALWADPGLSLDFAQRRSGPLTIRSLNEKTMDPGC